MEKLIETISTQEVILPIVVIIVGFLLCIICKKIISKIFNLKMITVRDGKKKTIANLVTNIITVVIFLITVFILFEIYNVDTKSFTASLGVVSVVVGLAIQDMLKDLIIGITIILEGQYAIGDWIRVNSYNNTFVGQVMPSSLRTTKIKAYTGEVKIIYNRNIIDIINYSLEKANLVIDIDVVTASDIEKVQKVLDELCIELKKKYNLKNIFCAGINSIDSTSIKFRVVALSRYSDQFRLDHDIKKEILLAFAKNDIKIP